jgi:hypothetical protein
MANPSADRVFDSVGRGFGDRAPIMMRVLKWLAIIVLFFVGLLGLIWHNDHKKQSRRRGHH